jgi:putative transposase
MLFASHSDMARAPIIRTSEFPYHVMSRTNNKEWFQIPMEECWEIFINELIHISIRFGVKIGSFVLMSNHFHMIFWTPNENLDEIMQVFLWNVSCKINKRANRTNHVFGSRYKWCLIQDERYLAHVYKYVYINPIKAGLCSRVEDYLFSTLQYVIQNQESKFKLHDSLFEDFDLVSKDVNKRLEWLNNVYTNEQYEFIKKRVGRSVFVMPKHKNYRKLLQIFTPAMKLPGNLITTM